MKRTKKALAASMALGVTLTMGATTTILAQEETAMEIMLPQTKQPMK